MMGKGSKRRPCFIVREEWALRHDFAFGAITEEQFNQKMKEMTDVSGNSKNNSDEGSMGE